MLVVEYIIAWVFFALGVVYWSVFNSEVIGPVVFGIIYSIFGAYCLHKNMSAQVESKLMIIFIGAKILCALTFVLITLGIHRDYIYVSIFALIFFIGLMLTIPLYFKLRDGVVSKKIYLPVGGIIIAAVVVLSVIGYLTKILSSFSIFTIVMLMLSIGFLAASVAIALGKMQK